MGSSFSSHKMFLHSFDVFEALYCCSLSLSCTDLLVFLQNTVVKGTKNTEIFLIAFASVQISSSVHLVSSPQN